jgi:tetratricopeptide (TPR) repeat protein
MNILFCKNSGAYVKTPGTGAEESNFIDYNGRCYGYFRAKRKLALERHYKDMHSDQSCANDVLVVWVASDAGRDAKIVGWYKHARVYREHQFQEAFTDAAHNLDYNVEAAASDCFLLPADQRTFSIPLAASTGKGTGFGRGHFWYADSTFGQTFLIPQVLAFIDTYPGKFSNEVFDDEIFPAVGSQDTDDTQFAALFNVGAKSFEKGDYQDALDLFKAARRVSETPNVLYNIAGCLEALHRYDNAITIYERLLESEGDQPEILFGLLRCYDFIGNREKTLTYCRRVLPRIVDASDGEVLIDGKALKVEICIVMARIYYAMQDYDNSRAAIQAILAISKSKENKQIVKAWEADLDQQLSKR